MNDAFDAQTLGLMVALGCGLLIGLERERRKGQGDDRRAAGIRSFTVAAVMGALAQSLGDGWLVAIGALLIVALVSVAYFKSSSYDPGITTELALFATYLVGVQATVQPEVAAGCAAGLAALLAARGRLHRFATQVLSEQELHDGLLLAALALVVLPLTPSKPLAWLGGINPRPLAATVLLILMLQALGHVALRLLGPRGGLPAAGFFGGFISSTATIASLGARARRHPAHGLLMGGSAALSTAATWVQALMLAAVLSPAAARVLAPAAFAGLLAAVMSSGMLLWSARGQGDDEPQPLAGDRALNLSAAVLIAGVLALVTLAVASAQRHLGTMAMLTGASLAGLADAHSPITSLFALFAAGGLDRRELNVGVLLAISSNSATRTLVAFSTGGMRFGIYACAALAAGLAAAWSAAYTTGGLA